MFSLKSIALLIAASGVAFAAPVSKPVNVLEDRQQVCPNDQAGNWPFEIVNKWRANYGLPQLRYDPQLHANALKTVNDCHAQYYQHQLNTGTYGQVLAFGYKTPVSGWQKENMTPFEMTLVGGWLCERPDAPELGGNCPQYEANAHMMMIPGDTGHVDIIMNPAYKSVGCGFAQDPNKSTTTPLNGMWGCDFGY